MKVFDIFASLSDLKPNKTKCQVAGIGALKEAKMCGMTFVDLRLNTMKTYQSTLLALKKVLSYC